MGQPAKGANKQTEKLMSNRLNEDSLDPREKEVEPLAAEVAWRWRGFSFKNDTEENRAASKSQKLKQEAKSVVAEETKRKETVELTEAEEKRATAEIRKLEKEA